MRTKFSFMIPIAFCLQFVGGCKKEDKSTPINSTFSANINGVAFNASSNFALLNVDSSLQIRNMVITGSYKSQLLSIAFGDSILNQIVDTNSHLYFLGTVLTFEDSSASTTYSPISSALYFTQCDTISRLTSGTFSGVLVSSLGDTIIVSNGVFKGINYIWQHSN